MSENKKKNHITTTVDINLGNDFMTDKIAANVLLSIVKFLLFNRNQIPFVYETFHYMTKQLVKARAENSENSECKSFVRNYAIERQRDIAIQTHRKFSEISDLISKVFENNEIAQAIVMFGATTFTSKEAFIVNLPSISKNHFAANHPHSSDVISRKVLRSIVTSKNFFDVNCSDLRPTNMYVIFKPKYAMNSVGDEYKHHSTFKLPASCRETYINIENDLSNGNLNCCRSLSIFGDIEMSNHVPIINDSIDDQSKIIGTKPSSNCNSFYECNVVVKGFKDPMIKGQSIWVHQVSHN